MTSTEWYRANKHRPEVQERKKAAEDKWRSLNRDKYLALAAERTARYRAAHPERARASIKESQRKRYYHRTLEALQKEITKCDVLCSNCHRRRHPRKHSKP